MGQKFDKLVTEEMPRGTLIALSPHQRYYSYFPLYFLNE